MSKNILIIGGTRYFGRRLVADLLAAGHRVTLATRGRASDDFGARVGRIRVDRRDRAAMRDAFAKADYDLIYDQVCYSPLDAAIAAEVFAGRTGRYLMASTLEVYRPQLGRVAGFFREDDFDPALEAVDPTLPWHDPAAAERLYSAGKRQAEAVLVQDGRLPAAFARIAHVLSGPEDFTGRLAHYVRRVQAEEPLLHSGASGRTSFIGVQSIADFLRWAGEASFLGAINAADHGALSALDLHRRVAVVAGREAGATAVDEAEPATLSPFDYAAPYGLDTGRAATLGYRFDATARWLDDAIVQHLAARS